MFSGSVPTKSRLHNVVAAAAFVYGTIPVLPVPTDAVKRFGLPSIDKTSNFAIRRQPQLAARREALSKAVGPLAERGLNFVDCSCHRSRPADGTCDNRF